MAQELNYGDTLPKAKTIMQLEKRNGMHVRANVLSIQESFVNLQEIGEEEPGKIDWKDEVWWREVGETENIYTLSIFNEQENSVMMQRRKNERI